MKHPSRDDCCIYCAKNKRDKNTIKYKEQYLKEVKNKEIYNEN